MEKVKTSQLLNELRTITEKSFERQQKTLNDNLQELVNYESTPDYKTILEIISHNNEYLTSAYIQAIIAILLKHNLIEHDLNN